MLGFGGLAIEEIEKGISLLASYLPWFRRDNFIKKWRIPLGLILSVIFGVKTN